MVNDVSRGTRARVTYVVLGLGYNEGEYFFPLACRCGTQLAK